MNVGLLRVLLRYGREREVSANPDDETANSAAGREEGESVAPVERLMREAGGYPMSDGPPPVAQLVGYYVPENYVSPETAGTLCYPHQLRDMERKHAIPLYVSGVPVRRERLCEMCGRDYPIWCADNELWNAVMRGGNQLDPDDHEFVCPTCFCMKAALDGVETAFWLSRIPWDG